MMTSMLQNPFLPQPYQVHALRTENPDTVSFELRLVRQDRPAPEFLPGQFNMLYAFGVGEIPVSISALPDAECDLTHTIRAVGAISTALCHTKEGDVIGLRGPFGRAWPIEGFAGHDLVIIAGGLGLAPLRPVLRWAMKNPKWFTRVVLLYGTRSPRLLIFSEDLKVWRNSGTLKVETTVDTTEAGWQGHVGSVATMIAAAIVHPARTIAFICGPEIMMRFATTELLQEGVASDRIFISMERNMKCAIGICGHCQYGKSFICKDGPVLPFSAIKNLFFWSEI